MHLKKLIFTLFYLLAPYVALSQNTQMKYLSGMDKDHTVNWDFYCSKGSNSGKWSKISVPSCWELKGFGTYNYGWEENYKENETGFYKFKFQSDPSWKDKTVRIVFEGSMTDTEVKINGQSAGEVHRGSFYRFKYDITSLLKKDNLLEVKVNKISADTSVNRAERMSDFWVFGGIYRPVYLEVLPKQFIDWTAIDAKADGSFLLEAYPLGVTDATTIEAQIKTLDDRPVGRIFSAELKKGDTKVLLNTKIDNPKTWNPESPELYKVEVRLKNAKGIVHAITEKFGFRTVEFREGVGFFVNNQKIMFKGVNRHSFWPTSGRTTSKEVSVLDINLIKDMNMNAVRMSHYPPDAHFLDACDSLGLFVLDELTGWQKKYDTAVGRKLLKEMVIKDVNHPSIVIWDNGNEGGNNHELVDDYAKYDPQKRKVIHPWNVFQGTDTQHYKGYDCCAGSLYHGNLVFFPTEILHGIYDGGNGAGLNDHWKLMLNNPLSAGCFLWCFADEGIVRHDMNNKIDVKGTAAPDGIVSPYREKEGSFYTIKDIWSPVQIKNQSLIKGFDGTLDVENRYTFTNLNQISFEWKVVKLAGPQNVKSQGGILSEGQFFGPDLSSGQTGKMKIDLPAGYQLGHVLYLKATDSFKREVFTWSWPLKTTPDLIGSILKVDLNEKAMMRENDSTLTLSANGVQVGFSKTTGLITQVRNALSLISLNSGPVLAAGSARFKSWKAYADSGNYVLELWHEGNLKKVKYTMLARGILKLEYAYSLYKGGSENTYDYVGINFNYPEEKITGVKYLGRGPYRVWKNRMKGGRFAVWDKKYNDTVTGESWNYPEFKGYYSDFKWVVIENKEYPFTIYTETENLFLRLYTPKKPGIKNDFTSPPFPSGDLSFLHGISPIGTKFDGADNHGPEGSKNKVGPEWISATLYFDFQ